MSSINSFPNETLGDVFQYLAIPTLGTAARVSQKWNSVLQCESLWKRVFEMYLDDANFPPSVVTWKDKVKIVHNWLTDNATIVKYSQEEVLANEEFKLILCPRIIDRLNWMGDEENVISYLAKEGIISANARILEISWTSNHLICQIVEPDWSGIIVVNKARSNFNVISNSPTIYSASGRYVAICNSSQVDSEMVTELNVYKESQGEFMPYYQFRCPPEVTSQICNNWILSYNSELKVLNIFDLNTLSQISSVGRDFFNYAQFYVFADKLVVKEDNSMTDELKFWGLNYNLPDSGEHVIEIQPSSTQSRSCTLI